MDKVVDITSKKFAGGTGTVQEPNHAIAESDTLVYHQFIRMIRRRQQELIALDSTGKQATMEALQIAVDILREYHFYGTDAFAALANESVIYTQDEVQYYIDNGMVQKEKAGELTFTDLDALREKAVQGGIFVKLLETGYTGKSDNEGDGTNNVLEFSAGSESSKPDSAKTNQ